MAAHRGHAKAGGRRKGTPNKTTAAVRAALVEAFDQLGGIPALVRWGKRQPAEFYKLWSKLLPVELKTDPLNVTARLVLVEEVIDRNPAADDPAPSGASAVPPQQGPV